MKKTSRRNSDGPNTSARMDADAAAATPPRQLGRTLLSRRVGGIRIRHAMTTLSVLTMAMVTFMIIMSATTSKGTGARQKYPDDHFSPLAHALSSSRRRNLSQLLPEEDNNKEKVENVEVKSGEIAKDDDEQLIRTQLRQLSQTKETGNQGKTDSSGTNKPQKDEVVIKSTDEEDANSKAESAADGSPPDAAAVSDNSEPGHPVQLEPVPDQLQVIELIGDTSMQNFTTNVTDTDELDQKVIQGLGQMLHHLPTVNLTPPGGTSTIVTDPLLSAANFRGRIHARKARPQNPYAPYAQTELANSIQEMEERIKGDPSLAVNTKPSDPLWANVSSLNLTSLDIHPQVPYLGVLVDAGRHYFPIVWLKNLLLYLHAMNFNFVHFRLTDDQTFNIKLTSYPLLASPVTYNNPDHLVYSKEELRDLVQFAEALNITIMPEVNIPGHAGSWAGVPGLVVNCPEFVCQKGYGVPINVTHPDLAKILTSILQEVREVFYTSPFLHLGGDEVHMAKPCFDELGEELFDYGPFEIMLKEVLKNLNISNDMVLRWEMTGQQLEGRAGKMIHFWESDPGQRINATGPYFISNGLYFDTNGRDRAFEVYQKTSRHLHSDWTPYLQAIVAGTFELDPDFWLQRNVIGRLIGVAMGASGKTYDQISNFTADYSRYCEQLQIDRRICKFEGLPLVEQNEYYGNWQGAWSVWKNGICERMTTPVPSRTMLPVYNWRQQMLEQVNHEFWYNFAREPLLDKNGTVMRVRIKPPRYDFMKINISTEVAPIRQHAVRHTGVILDLVNSHPSIRQLEDMIDQIALLGFNLIQLRLADDFGYAMGIPISQGNRLEFKRGRYGVPISYDQESLARVVDYAQRQGDVMVMPEISISTNAGGWYKVGFGLACPLVICGKGRGVANDITEPELLPVVSAIIRDFRKIFSSDFVHLGADERQQSVECFNESRKRTSFNTFERKLNALLEMEGVNTHNVLRWENQEHKRYRGRAGKITHFREFRNSSDVRRPDKGESFFANTNIFEGTAWDIYRKTREVVSLKPLGLMAEIRVLLAWSDRNTFARLLAFSLGVSTLPEWSEEAQFRGNFTEFCQAMLGKLEVIEEDDCKWFEPEQQAWEVEVETDASRQQSCNAQTYIVTKRLVRTNITAY